MIFFDELHVGRTLRKAMKRSDADLHDRSRLPRRHPRLRRHAARRSRTAHGSRADIVDAYIALPRRRRRAQRRGVARRSELVGGLYGVDAGGVFTGESMFHRASDASKLALLFLVEHLRARGATWLDCQVMTPHMEALGAREICARAVPGLC